MTPTVNGTRRSFGPDVRSSPTMVSTARQLRVEGVIRRQLAGEVAVGRWQRAGLAVVAHNGPLTREQRWAIGLIHAGPNAVLTAFTAVEALGVRGWERPEVHVLAPAGTRPRARSPVPFVLHRHRLPARREASRRIELLPDGLVRAAGTFADPRPACGLLAAAVQQRRTDPESLRESLVRASRVRHRRLLRSAVEDIAGGSEALSEIDFVQLCRRYGVPTPERQARRSESSGRVRYLDATWRRSDGRLVVAEVDGALHRMSTRWWDDQMRQNELALADALVLRFPSTVVRSNPLHVVSQLPRALLLP